MHSRISSIEPHIRMTNAPRFEPLADDAVLIHLGTAIDPACNACVHALAARIRTMAPGWLRDLVPAYASLGVYFDDRVADADDVREWLRARCVEMRETTEFSGPRIRPSRPIEIPVRYGGAFGEDFDFAAAQSGLTADELIARHTATVYTVAMIGFAPGFPYLSGLDPTLALPRAATPRTRVRAGSVGIGGAQTGIYPRESPGGWRLIGRTPLTLFDAQREAPSLLAPGDRVRFVAIDDDAFAQLAARE
jgi:KipI family sensor histidine kinase inhibitor